MRCTLVYTTPPKGQRQQRHGAADQPSCRRTAGARPRGTDQVPERRRAPGPGGTHLVYARVARRRRLRPVGLGRPQSQPTFHYRYLQHPNDMRRVREGLRLAVRLLESDAYKDVADYRIHPTDAILADDDALDHWIRQTVGTARHVSGTCKMGPDADPLAVVDQYCRVKGVQGLWVVDASVMPRIPRSGGCPCHGGHDRRTGRRLDCVELNLASVWRMWEFLEDGPVIARLP